MRGRADHKDLAVAWLNTAHPVVTRREGDAFALLQVAAAQGLGVEPLNVEFMLAVWLELVAQARQLATTPEAVIRAGGLPAIGVVIRARQATGHVGFTVVILQQAVEGSINQMWTITALQMHPKGIIVADEAACADIKVGTYNYFKDIEKDNLCPCSLLK